jgi:hypothetical protein
VVYASPARLAQRLSQSRTNDLAGLKLESRGDRTDRWDAELRPRQNKCVGGDAARCQSVENILKACSRIHFCCNRIGSALWLQ